MPLHSPYLYWDNSLYFLLTKQVKLTVWVTALYPPCRSWHCSCAVAVGCPTSRAERLPSMAQSHPNTSRRPCWGLQMSWENGVFCRDLGTPEDVADSNPSRGRWSRVGVGRVGRAGDPGGVGCNQVIPAASMVQLSKLGWTGWWKQGWVWMVKSPRAFQYQSQTGW